MTVRPPGDLVRLMLGEGAQVEDRQAEIGAEHVEPDRNAAEADRPEEDDREAQRVVKPRADDLRSPAPISCMSRPTKPTNMTSGPISEAAEEGVVEVEHPLQPGRQPLPVRDREIEAFGVVVGIGQRRIVVMPQVQHLEAAIGKQQPERQEDQRLVQRRGARRMAVQRLVLQRGMQRHQRRGDEHQQERADLLVERR